jgi:hypothetical protein
MRTIRISDAVWQEIAKRGEFGETPDIVLRRVFNIANEQERVRPQKSRKRHATDRMSAYIENGSLHIEFARGVEQTFELPETWDKAAISDVTANVMTFVKENDGSIGQINAARKALTDAGYHITK